LAKELNVDSKQLVTICNKAGVTGKGSALASLDDEEVGRIKSYLAAGKGVRSAPLAAGRSTTSETQLTGNLKREDYIAPAGGGKAQKPKVIVTPKKRPAAAPEPPVAPAAPAASSAAPTAPPAPVPPPSTPPAESPGAHHPAAAPSKPSPSRRPPLKIGSQREAPAKPEPPRPERVGLPSRFDAPVRPDPTKAEPKRPVTVQPTPKSPAKKSDDELPKPPAKKEPTIRLAAVPQSPAAPPPPKKDEPTPQKPIIALPKEAIRGAKEGSKAPLEQFTKQQEKKRKASEKGKRKAGTPVGAAGEELGERPAKAGRDRRRGRGGPEKEGGESDMADMVGTREARQRKRRDRKAAERAIIDTEDEPQPRARTLRRRRITSSTAAPRKEKVVLELPCTVRSFSEASGIATGQILKALMGLGTLANINAQIDRETAELLAADIELDIEFKEQKSLEDTVLTAIREREDDPELLQSRPPVVTFLGHVDHGKTSLLDRIIGIDVVSGEAGGITQHIRAYIVDKDGRQISFVDTPGHEAFTEMRARGTNVTDIAVLVVAAEDGVMPQTEEAISHAKAAEVPIVVAMNKIDLPGANPERVLQQLSTHDLLPAEWGGDVEVVKTSATTGEGIGDLLETLLLTADIHEYKANPERPAYGTCLEAQQEGGRGVVAKMIVQNGTLRVGDVIVCGAAYGRVKAMYDTLDVNRRVREVGPSTPVNVTGLDLAPDAGESFYVLDDIAAARGIATDREQRSREQSLSGYSATISFEEFQRRREEGTLGTPDETATLNLIIRADVRGSLEAIQKELAKFEHPEVAIRVLQATVGGITVADVTLAHASGAVIAGFNVIPDEAARALADERGVEIRRYNVIYKLTDDIKALIEGKLKPEERVVELGRALVQRVYSISRVGNIAGCRVLAGTIERGCRIRVNRDSRGIGEYDLESLRREKDDAKEVREGFECGMKLAGFNDVKEGDILEAFKTEEHKRTLESSR
jgi:translation initiation factor IF-2